VNNVVNVDDVVRRGVDVFAAFDVCDGVGVGDKEDGEAIDICEIVGTLWYEIVEVIAGEVGVGVIVVE
jgi:hypothetical protein